MMLRFGNTDYCVGDCVIIDTADGCCYQGEIIDIYAFAHGQWGNHGLALELQTVQGEYVDLDDSEIANIQYMKY